MGKGGKLKTLMMLRIMAVTLVGGGVLCASADQTAFGQTANTGIFADNSCDPLYYDSLEARAWMEAQREIVQNQNLIFKPDSVLEYTCFDRHLNVLANTSQNLFSGNPEYGGNPQNVATNLTNAMSAPIRDYINDNFGHTFLGGRSTHNYTAGASVQAGGYTCNMMDQVWIDAKCMEFADIPDQDGFFTFDDYAATGSDYRRLPSACNTNGAFDTRMETAVGSATPWEEDRVVTYMDIIFPDNDCGDAASMVPTGVVVAYKDNKNTYNFDYYTENVCLVSGCYYQPNANTVEDYDDGSGVDKQISRSGTCVSSQTNN